MNLRVGVPAVSLLHLWSNKKKIEVLTGFPVTFRACSLHASMCQRMCLNIAHVATMYMSLPFSEMLHV